MAGKNCQCKKSKHECEECPEWIFTFADLVMLMMGFFVILWVLKPAPSPHNDPTANDDWVKVAAAIREAFDYIPDPQSKDPVDIEMLLQKLQKMKINGPGQGGKTLVPKAGATGTDPEVTNIRQSLHATEGGKLLFSPGSAALTDGVKKALNEIADIVRGHRTIVIIKGHTSLDDLPDTSTAQQKMDLSIRRAQAAADYLMSVGVDPEIMRVQGCSTFEPLVQRVYTPDSQVQNRRVEVEATATLVSDLQDNHASTAPSTNDGITALPPGAPAVP
jgi:flagellar motor protein MotB